MRQRRNQNRSKLYMAMIALVTALVVLIMASYAWYTLSTNPEIKGLNFHVSGDVAIQVSQDGTDYSYSEDLSRKVADIAGLVPVSTVDGLNWFECKYDLQGNVLQTASTEYGTQFLYFRFPEGGNVRSSLAGQSGAGANPAPQNEEGSLSAEPESGQPEEETNHSYYVYTDIWLKTTAEETDVYLSIPSGSGNYQADAEEKNHYGSYVMSYYTKDGRIILTSGGSETSARVGFLMLGEADAEGNYAEPEKTQAGGTTVGAAEYPFYIYEPNADRRSQADKSSDEYKADKYIAGFLAREFYGTDGRVTYQDAGGYYFPTYPVLFNEATKTAVQSKLDSNATFTTVDNGDGKPCVFPADRLIVQKASTWRNISTGGTTDPDSGENTGSSDPEGESGGGSGSGSGEGSGSGSEGGSESGSVEGSEGESGSATPETPAGTPVDQMTFDSRLISNMGSFISAANLYEGMHITSSTTLSNGNADYKIVNTSGVNTDLRSAVKLTTLKKDKPQKVRLYFWIEGQDIDCWNDIADTDFLVNLEFVGDIKK